MKRQMYANTLFIIFDPFISIKYICLDKWQKMLYYLFGMKNFRFIKPDQNLFIAREK